MVEIYRPYSRLVVRTERLKEFIDAEVSAPERVKDFTIKNRNGKLSIAPVPEDEEVGKYTPVAEIKAKQTTETIVIDEDEGITHQSVSEYEQESGWGSRRDEDESLNVEDIEYCNFYGHEGEVIINDALREEMFDLLCEIAEISHSGFVRGIRATNDDLEPVYIEAGGEKPDVNIEINKEQTKAEDTNEAVQWTH